MGKRSHSVRPCGTNGSRLESFKAYVEQFLVPTLKPGDTVIMDNLGSHKGHVVRRAIRRREASVPASSRCSPS
jgi:transposase